jgi:hypothetical protein
LYILLEIAPHQIKEEEMRKFLSIMVVLALPFANAACEDDDPVVPPTPTSRFMVVHASPDTPSLDVYVSGNGAKDNLVYPGNTGYLTIDAGFLDVRLQLTAPPHTILYEAQHDFAEDDYYTLFIDDTMSNLDWIMLTDDLSTPASGQTRLRFLHLSPDAPAIDITTQTGTVLFPDHIFEEVTPFTDFAAGTYDLQVRNAGTTNVLFDIPPRTFQAGKVYTIFLKGLVAGTGTQALGVQVITNK